MAIGKTIAILFAFVLSWLTIVRLFGYRSLCFRKEEREPSTWEWMSWCHCWACEPVGAHVQPALGMWPVRWQGLHAGPGDAGPRAVGQTTAGKWGWVIRRKEKGEQEKGNVFICWCNNLASKRELLGQVQPWGGMGDCSFPECAGGGCKRPGPGESPECSRELVTARSGTTPGLGRGTQRLRSYPECLHAVVYTESKP